MSPAVMGDANKKMGDVWDTCARYGASSSIRDRTKLRYKSWYVAGLLGATLAIELGIANPVVEHSICDACWSGDRQRIWDRSTECS